MLIIIKVFISHKKEDKELALLVKSALDRKQISSYLDVLDNTIINDGKALTEHIKVNLNSCTDVIVVMTESTKFSWWVPFEIGMLAQKNMPTASFLSSDVKLPDYLSYWPRLKNLDDISTYVDVRLSYNGGILEQYGLSSAAKINTHDFYQKLKEKLG